MTHPARTRLETFTENDLPDLDEVVLGSLDFLSEASFPELNIHVHERPLVVGSGNAFQTGKLLFAGTQATFAEEGEAIALLHQQAYDALYIISASGSKHAIMLAEAGTKAHIPTYLVTANGAAPARAIVGSENTFVFPHIREPYTYNTSTYLSMIFGVKKESPGEILSFIEEKIAPLVPQTLESFSSFTFVIGGEYGPIRNMFETKFDELFGPFLHGRSFTREEIKHAKTVVTAPTQCIISFGSPLTLATNSATLTIPLPQNCGPAALIAIGYYIIGHIQKVNPPYYKDNIAAYVEETSRVFGHHISTIVE